MIEKILKEAHWIKKADHEHACLMVRVPYRLNQHILTIGNSIDKSKLHEEGLEKLIHVTVLYGFLSSDKNKLKFRGLIELENEPKISYFDNDKQTVAIVKIQSARLGEIHNYLKGNFSNQDKHEEYLPHITIAYLKPGERLGEIKIPIVKWAVDRFLFIAGNGSQEEIMLKMK